MKACYVFLLIILLLGCDKEELFDPQKITPISNVESYQDIRWKDLSKIEEQLDSNIIPTLIYNEKTIWPASYRAYANEILEKGKKPGLGVSNIHVEGITGNNVNVGIIDQALGSDYHPEYEGKVLEYYNTAPELTKLPFSTHGPAVLSVLVGEKTGVAPDANVYYAEIPGNIPDAKYYADALDWLIQKNSTLADGEKIRVVSVSAGPSGDGSLFTENRELWDQAYQKAIDSNILVLDCTPHHRLNSVCYYDIFNVDDISKCRPGYPDLDTVNTDQYENIICAPSSFRTVAEHVKSGDYSYRYSGKGGMSWAVPYVAGVLALGWQINPNLSNEQIIDLLFETAYVYNEEFRIINPEAFVGRISENH